MAYVAASMAGLARLADPAGTALRALWSAVGTDGTLVMPSGSRSFRFSGFFDREASTSESGLLSEQFRTGPGVRRTSVPPFNTICAAGALGRELAAIESQTAFGPGSVFDRLVDCQVRDEGVELCGDPAEQEMLRAAAIAAEVVGLTRISAFRLRRFAEVLDDWFAVHSDVMIRR